MRDAVARAFRELTGRDAQFIFSGWAAELTALQRQIVLEKGPGVDHAHFVGFNKGGKA